ncbi:MAG TPA: hypothetical protein VEY67_00555 [Candidatus Dormibacteraeota bacterium]|nr:hypothetical protein [Candidatus Dormibacteraeota bacterium]
MKRLEAHAAVRLTAVEGDVRRNLEPVLPLVWRAIGEGRPEPTLEWAAFHADGGRRLELLGSYDAVRHAIRLNADALAIAAALHRHPTAEPHEACFESLVPALHPAALARPLVHPLVHEAVHAATPIQRLPFDPPSLPSLPDGATPLEVLRWPFYEQVVVRLADGSVVGTAVEPRRRGLLEGLTDAIAGRLVAALTPALPPELAEPIGEPIRRGHARLARPDYPARDVLEALFSADEQLALLVPATEPTAVRDRLRARLPDDLFALAWGSVSGDLDRFAATLPPEHPFRRLGWRSIAAWLRDPDAHVAA